MFMTNACIKFRRRGSSGLFSLSNISCSCRG